MAYPIVGGRSFHVTKWMNGSYTIHGEGIWWRNCDNVIEVVCLLLEEAAGRSPFRPRSVVEDEL